MITHIFVASLAFILAATLVDRQHLGVAVALETIVTFLLSWLSLATIIVCGSMLLWWHFL